MSSIPVTPTLESYSVRTSQPPQPVGIDWGNPITKDSVFQINMAVYTDTTGTFGISSQVNKEGRVLSSIEQIFTDTLTAPEISLITAGPLSVTLTAT